MSDYLHRTQVLSLTQPFGSYYVAILPAQLLLDVAFTDTARITDRGPTGYRIAGTQRDPRAARWREIGKFIDTVEAVFPTSIVLAANYGEDGELEEGKDRWRVETNDDGQQFLIIPGSKKLVSVVDGQHRLWGFAEAAQERRSMPLVCSIFLDLPNPFQAYVFATVNFNQKKVDRSLAYELFGFDTEEEAPEAWTPEKTAVYLTRRLNVDETSPLKGHIIVAPQDDEGLIPKGEWRVSTATIVDGLLRLFSKKPKADRSKMYLLPRTKRNRRDLPDDGSPARELYRATNDLAIYTLVVAFLRAADAALWKTAGQDSYIRKTVGLQALFDVLLELTPTALAERRLTTDFFLERLNKAQHIDFEDNFFQASGGGKTRIKNSLRLALGLKNLESIPEDDRGDYERLVVSVD